VAEQQHSGWAENDEPTGGGPPFISDMGPPLGVWAQDMPAGGPPPPPPPPPRAPPRR
jgi:hypothetical protein